MKNADKELVEVICHCVYNLLKGNLNISNVEKEKLCGYKTAMRKLVKKSTLDRKKKILVQQGGFLEYLIPAAITGISSIISSFISNNNSNVS